MGRKHNDVFVLGPEPLDFDADSGLGDERKAEPAARARPEPGAPARTVEAGSQPQRGLGHRPLSRRPAASRPNPAERLIGRDGPRRPFGRRAAALAAAVGVGTTIVAARLISAGGGEPERAPTSPAAQLAQVEPTSPAAPPAPVVPSPRPRRGAGPRNGPERHPATRQSSQSPSQVPPQPVAPADAPTRTVYPTAEAFGFER